MSRIEKPEEMAGRRWASDRPGAFARRRYDADLISERDLTIGRAILAAVDSTDPFPLLRALAAELGAETEQPRPPPVVVPEASALTCDMALRFLYDPGGVFILPGRPLHVPAPGEYDVRGLRVRICYERRPEDAAAAEDCAASWVGRMLMSGAESVVAEGEEVGA